MAKVTKVRIFSTQTCPYCKMEKAYLDEKSVKYENIFVDLDPAAAQQMIEKSGQMGVPVTEFTYEDGKIEYLLGFNKPKIDQILGLQ